MDYVTARHNMVEGQIRTNRVTDPRIVAALGAVPREAFLPRPLQAVAYVDEALPLGGGRHLMEPMVLGRLLQAAEIGPDDVVLVIGAGCGYAAAVTARLGSTVVAVESDGEMAARAGANLEEQGIDNAAVVEGGLAEGYPKQGPYDVIFINGGVDQVPPAIVDQLGEGGRLVAVVNAGRVGTARLYLRTGGIVAARDLFEAGTPTLPGLEAAPAFVF
ncbi:MAG: protein-L-isoaspartate O-methyltransferase [Hyphomicrobiales bacterium]|nr:protein-L-isoaspartate O-methyltransferase [Hyphomicrobiales bacterium]MCP5374423.1 protein-L-isoaspartate O-methyltransferase [Hyphomicrobiales bacterium]